MNIYMGVSQLLGARASLSPKIYAYACRYACNTCVKAEPYIDTVNTSAFCKTIGAGTKAR